MYLHLQEKEKKLTCVLLGTYYNNKQLIHSAHLLFASVAWNCRTKGREPGWLEASTFTFTPLASTWVHWGRLQPQMHWCRPRWGPRSTTSHFLSPTCVLAVWLAENKVPLFLALHRVPIPKSRYPTWQQTCCQNVMIYPSELGRLKGAIQLQVEVPTHVPMNFIYHYRVLNQAYMTKRSKTRTFNFERTNWTHNMQGFSG